MPVAGSGFPTQQSPQMWCGFAIDRGQQLHGVALVLPLCMRSQWEGADGVAGRDARMDARRENSVRCVPGLIGQFQCIRYHFAKLDRFRHASSTNPRLGGNGFHEASFERPGLCSGHARSPAMWMPSRTMESKTGSGVISESRHTSSRVSFPVHFDTAAEKSFKSAFARTSPTSSGRTTSTSMSLSSVISPRAADPNIVTANGWTSQGRISCCMPNKSRRFVWAISMSRPCTQMIPVQHVHECVAVTLFQNDSLLHTPGNPLAQSVQASGIRHEPSDPGHSKWCFCSRQDKQDPGFECWSDDRQRVLKAHAAGPVAE